MYPCPSSVVICETGKRPWLRISAGGVDGPIGPFVEYECLFPGSWILFHEHFLFTAAPTPTLSELCCTAVF